MIEKYRFHAPSCAGAAFPFTLTARAENFLFSRPDLDDTIARLRAFEAARELDTNPGPPMHFLSGVDTDAHPRARAIN
jgi:hypothetical protein